LSFFGSEGPEPGLRELERLWPEAEYREFAHPYHVKVFSRLGDRVPAILFVKEQPLVELMVDSGADVLSVGTCVDLAEARRRFGHKVAFQGNVDNRLLVSGTIDAEGNVSLEPAFTLELPPRLPPPGSHTLELIDASGALLASYPFEPAALHADRIAQAFPPRLRPPAIVNRLRLIRHLDVGIHPLHLGLWVLHQILVP